MVTVFLMNADKSACSTAPSLISLCCCMKTTICMQPCIACETTTCVERKQASSKKHGLLACLSHAGCTLVWYHAVSLNVAVGTVGSYGRCVIRREEESMPARCRVAGRLSSPIDCERSPC